MLHCLSERIDGHAKFVVAQAKTNISIGFGFGTLEVKSFAVQP